MKPPLRGRAGPRLVMIRRGRSGRVRARRAVLAVAAAAWEEMEAVTADPGAGGEARAMALGKMATAMTILLHLASVWSDHPVYARAARRGVPRR